MDWWNRNSTDFAWKAGLVPDLVRDLGLQGEDKSLFLAKVNLIFLSVARAEKAEAGHERSED